MERGAEREMGRGASDSHEGETQGIGGEGSSPCDSQVPSETSKLNVGKEPRTSHYEAGLSSRHVPRFWSLYRWSRNDAQECPIYQGFPHAFNSNKVINEVIRIAETWSYEEVTQNFTKYLNEVSYGSCTDVGILILSYVFTFAFLLQLMYIG